MPKTHDIVTKLPDIIHDNDNNDVIGSHDMVAPFLTRAIWGFWTRYRDKIPDIGPDISDLPFLDGHDIGKSPILCKNNTISPTMSALSGTNIRNQDIRISCLECTDIVPDVSKNQYGYRVFARADQYRPPPATLRRRPPPAALATGAALSVLHARTLCTPRGH
jgi:hypothetical protein